MGYLIVTRGVLLGLSRQICRHIHDVLLVGDVGTPAIVGVLKLRDPI